MTSLPAVDGIRKLLFYGGPLAQLQESLTHDASNTLSVQVLYQLAVRYGVISPSAAREGLLLLPESDPAAEAGRKLLAQVLQQGDFLAVRVER